MGCKLCDFGGEIIVHALFLHPIIRHEDTPYAHCIELEKHGTILDMALRARQLWGIEKFNFFMVYVCAAWNGRNKIAHGTQRDIIRSEFLNAKFWQ